VVTSNCRSVMRVNGAAYPGRPDIANAGAWRAADTETSRVPRDRCDLLRDLASRGQLADIVASAAPSLRNELASAAYAVTWPVVFNRLTRGIELRRGHPACARSVGGLADDCLDRFHDDVEAAVKDVLRHADQPIHKVEAWIAARLNAATVDGHRRRRGERGALQRPRVPKWLSDALGDDLWLTKLAVDILIWVGSAATAGAGLWPIDSWVYRRAVVTGDWVGGGPSTVEHEVEAVLAAMRRHEKWYADYVERPLGLKQSPVAVGLPPGDGPGEQARPLPLSQPYELDDAQLLELATEAIATIQVRLLRGDDERATIVEVIKSIFGTGRCDWGISYPPHVAPDYDDGRVAALFGDPAEVSRIVATVLRILQSCA
jgi:hypothetical protein